MSKTTMITRNEEVTDSASLPPNDMVGVASGVASGVADQNNERDGLMFNYLKVTHSRLANKIKIR